MPTIALTSDEIATLARALDMASNHLQTGDVVLCAADLIARKDPKRPPRALDVEQMRRVVAYADLRDRLLKADSDTHGGSHNVGR